MPDGIFLITDDERGIAPRLASALEGRQGRAVVVRWGRETAKLADRVYTADLTDPQAIAGLLDLVRPQGDRIAGIIHLLPLSAGVAFEQMTLDDWHARAQLEVKSLFHLTQAVAGDLKPSPTRQAGRLLAATSLGDVFQEAGTGRQPTSPVSAGVAGLIKTLALEWPEVGCKAVHFDLHESPDNWIEPLMQELTTDQHEPEVIYRADNRYVLQAERRPLDERQSAPLMIDADSVLLITGGARGITAAAAINLARQYRPTLILVGRSPLPPAHEAAETAGLVAAKEIKAAIIEQLRRAGETVRPARVETAFARLMQDREIRDNLATIEQAGGRVEYHQIDVRDGHAFAQIIEDVYRTYGRLDGVIHGAGVIEDKLIEDKTASSFDRVFDTKVTGAFVLARHLRPDVRFLVFFASVSGAFGNRGQADYAAANEVLNKIALYLDGQWPGRVIAINWGPWEGVGMVSEDMRRQFAQRGVELISPEGGLRALDRELRLGRKGEVAVVRGSRPSPLAAHA